MNDFQIGNLVILPIYSNTVGEVIFKNKWNIIVKPIYANHILAEESFMVYPRLDARIISKEEFFQIQMES